MNAEFVFTGALFVMIWQAQAEGYGWNGKLARTFKVISAQQLKDIWFLKEMRVQTPGNSTPTHLRIDKEK